VVEPRERANILDEGVDLLTRLWAGDEAHHLGRLKVDGVRISPGPVQEPRIPLWFACRGGNLRPVQRAARYDGIYPIEVDHQQMSRTLDVIQRARGSLDGFEIALVAHPGVTVDQLRTMGATWAMHTFWPGHTPEQVLRFLARGAHPMHSGRTSSLFWIASARMTATGHVSPWRS
jgi:alkanesulfonate monooxygenase SsuD/methylene tetrahydromethanopterin reductase-like flavin-dependent oxidoreductase (luciferase family)